MKHKLPPLNALKVFESVARNMGFTKAAKELFITQSAVSKQIKILEDYLGFTLFKRVANKLSLTRKAENYYQSISPLINSIRTVTHLIREENKQDNILNIDTLSSIGSYWLIPRLKSFTARYPDIKINISAGEGNIDFSQSIADVAIRVGVEKFAGVEDVIFMDEKIVAVTSPDLEEKISTIEDIYKFTILENIYRSDAFEEWISLSNLDQSKFTNRLKFEFFFMVVEAAKQGLGIGFVPKFLLDNPISRGDMVNLLGIKYTTKRSHRLIYPHESNDIPKVKAFHDWIIEMGQEK